MRAAVRDTRWGHTKQGHKGKKCLQALFKVMQKINAVETLQYIVALLNELIDRSNDRALGVLAHLSKSVDLYSPLLSFVHPLYAPTKH